MLAVIWFGWVTLISCSLERVYGSHVKMSTGWFICPSLVSGNPLRASANSLQNKSTGVSLLRNNK